MAVSVASYDNAAVWGPVVVSIAIVFANLLAWALNERSWAYVHVLHRVGVPKLLFISNRADGVPRTARPQTYWSFDLLDPHHLVESPVLNTFGLLVLHACTFLYWVAYVFVDVLIEWYGYGCHASWCWRRSGAYGEWATFLTNWSITILGLSGLVAFCNTLHYARRQRHSRHPTQQQHSQQQHVELSPHQPDSRTPAAAAGTAAAAAGAPAAPATLPAAGTAAAGAAGAAGAGGHGLPGPWEHVFHRGDPAAPDAAVASSAASASMRDHDQPHLQQQQQQLSQQAKLRQHGAPAGAGSDGSSSSGSSSSGGGGGGSRGSSCCGSNCDAAVMIGPEGSNGLSGKRRTEKWDALSVAHCLLSEVATTAAWFVSFWFWVGLVAIAGQALRANGGTLMAHAGNFGVALLQLLLTRLPIASTHFQVLLWYTTLYMIFLLAYGGGSGTWRYGLDVQRSYSAGALILVLLIVFIFFCLWFLLARLRESVLHRLQRRRQRRHATKAQRLHAAGREDGDGGAGGIGEAGGDAAV